MEPLNPFQVKAFIKRTSIDALMDMELFHLAKAIHQDVQDAWLYCHERPRWANLWDQLERAASSVTLNYAECLGKGRGYFASAGMICRGEAYELYMGLRLLPDEVSAPILPKVKRLCELLNQTLLDTPLDDPAKAKRF